MTFLTIKNDDLPEVAPMLKTKTMQILFVISLLIPFSQSYGASTSPKIMDGSIDAGARYFKVLCPDGKRTAVRVYFEEYRQFKSGDVCYKDAGIDICNKGNVDAVAVNACKAKKI
jgi:hypothetical protein